MSRTRLGFSLSFSAALISKSNQKVRRLFEGSAYSKVALVRMWRLDEGGAYLKVALIRRQRLFE